MENAEALVLRSIDFSETSLIVTLYTKEFGKIEALAKGGRRLKGPFESALDILARIRVTFIQKRGDALDLLTEAKLVKRFRVTKSNLAGLYGGYYVAELVHSLTNTKDPSPAIFDLATKTLAQLEQGTLVMRSLIRFEGFLLTLIGQQPSLQHCVDCGIVIDAEPKRRFAFGYLDGGVLCGRCASKLKSSGGQQIVSVSGEALRDLRRLTDPRDSQGNWRKISLDRNILGEIRGLLNQYISHQIGRRPRLYDWLKFISQNDKEK